jgi:hypothetical protein
MRRCRDAEGTTYLERLSAELGRLGIRGRLRDRILVEAADHLAEGDPDRFGDPAELARQFVDELGTAAARRAALRAFAALALAGAAYGVVGVSLGRQDVAGAPQPALGVLAAAGAVLLPQVAFVAGMLAALRAWRRRRALVVPAAEVQLVLRRTLVALAAGAGTLACAALYAFEFRDGLGAVWSDAALAAAGAAFVAVTAVAAATLRAARLRPQAAGPAGDLFDDLGPLVPARYRGRPWAFACLVALAAGGVVVFAGIAQSDPIDGAIRALTEALACLAGFWALRKPLGLRR